MLVSIVSMAAMALSVSAAAINSAAASAPTKTDDATPFHIIPLDANDPAAVAFLESQGEPVVPEDIAVVKEKDLYNYLSVNSGADRVVRVDGSDGFVDLRTVFVVTNETEGVDKRQFTSPPYGYSNWKVNGHDQWWDSWRPASGCVWTGLSPTGADNTLGWSYTKSISTSLSLGTGEIVRLLSAAVEFSVTQAWSSSGSVKCPIPGRSVGQIWIQNRIAWGNYFKQDCFSYSSGGRTCGEWYGQGGASAPRDTTHRGVGVNLGCSVGQANVQC